MYKLGGWRISHHTGTVTQELSPYTYFYHTRRRVELDNLERVCKRYSKVRKTTDLTGRVFVAAPIILT